MSNYLFRDCGYKKPEGIMPSGRVSHSLFSIRLFNLCDRRFLHRNTAVFVIAKFNDHIVICNV